MSSPSTSILPDVGLQGAEQRQQGALAAAALADDGSELALVDVEVDVVQGLHPAVAGLVLLGDVGGTQHQ